MGTGSSMAWNRKFLLEQGSPTPVMPSVHSHSLHTLSLVAVNIGDLCRAFPQHSGNRCRAFNQIEAWHKLIAPTGDYKHVAMVAERVHNGSSLSAYCCCYCFGSLCALYYKTSQYISVLRELNLAVYPCTCGMHGWEGVTLVLPWLHQVHFCTALFTFRAGAAFSIK